VICVPALSMERLWSLQICSSSSKRCRNDSEKFLQEKQ